VIGRLLENLESAGIPITGDVSAAMHSVDISDFTDYDSEPFWHDRPLVFLETIRGGIKTISAPHMIVTMLHHLELSQGQKVLILGAKGGYIAALIAHIVGPEGEVVVVDPSREVVDYVRERIASVATTHSVRVRKMQATNRCPPHLPEPLDRVLVTGALPSLPSWLERRMADGGFAVAPIGGQVAQRLVKRERQSDNWFDTDLGGVLFGPVDISDTEPEPLDTAGIAELLRECVVLGDEMNLFDQDTRSKLSNLAKSLDDLPSDIPPLVLDGAYFEDEPPWVLDSDNLDGDMHPALDLMMAEMSWLVEVWPILVALLDVQLIHPGELESDEDEERFGGYGRHSDLVP